MTGKIGAAALLLGFTIVARTPGVVSVGVAKPLPESFVQKTTKDKLYSKEQAARGAEQYVKFCEKCHTPEKVPEGKKPGPPVSGPKFLDTWADRTIGELFATIRDTMPSDGSTTLTESQSLDAVAHILLINGFPDGPAALKNDDAMKNAVIVK
jgi:mono/diheme cytochrome c family protein